MTNSRTRSSKLWIAGLMAVSLGLAYAPRVNQYLDWQDDRTKHFAGDVVTSNADAYYFFRQARDLYTGALDAKPHDMLRHHPDGVVRTGAPPLSQTLAFLARFTDGDVYQAGLWFSVLTSCLFMIPLMLYGWLVGWPAAGMLGGLFGIASVALITRTSLSRVEPDGVNLFALWGICLLFALVQPQSKPVRQFVAAAAAGISVAFFVAWYQKPSLHLFLAFGFVVSMLASRFPARRLALIVVVFLLASNPLMLGESARELLRTARIYATQTFEGRAAAPATQNGLERLDETTAPTWTPLEASSILIDEQTRLDLQRSLQFVLRPAGVAAVGLLAFGGWAIYHYRIAAPLIPLLLLGAMGLVTSKRFLMFLAPFPGFGLGVLLTLATRASLRRSRLAGHADAVTCALALGLFASYASNIPIKMASYSSVSSETLGALQQCAKDLPTGAVVWHSWGQSYIVQDVMGAATYTDGGVPHPVIDHLLLKALIGSDPHALQRTIAHLDGHPQNEVAAEFRADYAGAYERMLSSTAEISSPSFVLFTEKSMTKLRANAYTGHWSPATGRPGSVVSRSILCSNAGSSTLKCADDWKEAYKVDLRNGVAATKGQRVKLQAAFNIRDGFVKSVQRYPDQRGLILESLTPSSSQTFTAYVIGHVPFVSLVNQLYVLGRHDSRYLELVCDEFPYARLYRVVNN